MNNPRESGKITEIPISEDILKKSAAQILANPPLFPLLKGNEERQIEQAIIELIHSGKIEWKELLLDYPTYRAEYLGVEILIEIAQKDDLLTLKLYENGSISQVSFRGNFRELIKEIKLSGTVNNHDTSLEKIWKVLNT